MSLAVPEPLLFCGVRLSQNLSAALEKVSPHIMSLYLSEDPGSLKKINLGDAFFLGKYAGKELTDEEMALLSGHIASILQKLIPQYSMIDHPTIVIGCAQPHDA